MGVTDVFNVQFLTAFTKLAETTLEMLAHLFHFQFIIFLLKYEFNVLVIQGDVASSRVSTHSKYMHFR